MKGFCSAAATMLLFSATLHSAPADSLRRPYIEQLQKRDSILIADQIRYGAEFEGVHDGDAVALPDFSKGETGSLLFLGDWRFDTLKTRKGRRGAPSEYKIRTSITVTSFDEGDWELPGITVVIGRPDGRTDTLRYAPATLEVKTLPVDTATFVIHDIKPQVRYPLTAAEVLPYVAAAHLLAFLAVMIAYFAGRSRRKASGKTANEPPHIRALRKLDGFRGEKFWEPARQKSYYSGLTDTLREYISGRYGIGAMEMTTSELFAALPGEEIPEELVSRARELFELSDFVKFAKHTATREESAAALPFAVRFVMETYSRDLDESQKTDKEA